MSLTLRAALAAVVLIVPVSAELIWPSVGDSGHLLFAVAQLIGWFLVATVVRDGAGRHPETSSTRAGRVGRRLLLSGCALQILFALVYGGSAADRTASRLKRRSCSSCSASSPPSSEASSGGQRCCAPAWLASPASACSRRLSSALLAIAVGVDPFHDVFLLSSYAAWVLVGRGLEAPAQPKTKRSSEVSAASR